MMKIFILPSWYKTTQFPENCIFVYEQVRELSLKGHSIVVLSPQIQFNPFNCKDNSIITDEFSTIYYKNYWKLPGTYFSQFNITRFINAAECLLIKAIQDEGKPDVIYAHFTEPAGYAAVILGKKYDIPVVVEEHFSGYMTDSLSLFQKKILRYTIKYCEHFICVSSGLKKILEQQLGTFKNVSVVSNMINPCFNFNPPVDGRFVFFSMGSLIPRKGFLALIHAFTNTFRDQNVVLRIAGSGPEKKKLDKTIQQLGMENQIFMLGQLNREETLEEYIKCHCFVLASEAETFGLVYREALAVGRPIISTRHGGFSKEDWHNEFGYLIDKKNFMQLEQALKQMYKKYSTYDCSLISKMCLSTCSPSNVIDKIISILNGSIGNNQKDISI